MADLPTFLSAIPTISTKHMGQGERRAGAKTMLNDLFKLADRDGCIAAAWALEMLAELMKQAIPWRDGGARGADDSQIKNQDEILIQSTGDGNYEIVYTGWDDGKLYLTSHRGYLVNWEDVVRFVPLSDMPVPPDEVPA